MAFARAARELALPSLNVSVNAATGGGSIASNYTVTAGLAVSIDETIPASSTNVAISAGIDVSALQGLVYTADQACTIKVNSTGSPTKTITLSAGEVFVWKSGQSSDPLGSSDVTTLYVTCTPETRFQLSALVDPTP